MNDGARRELTYLDFCATTPVEPEVAELVMRHMVADFGNSGSRTHQMGNDAKKAVEGARREVACSLGVEPPEILFTSGATESNNLAILGLAEHGRRSGRTHIVTTQIEHKSVLEPCRHLEASGFSVTWVAPTNDGRVAPEEILGAVRDDTLLVSVMHANNETGVIQPIEQLLEQLHDRDVLTHVDAAQSFGKVPDWSCLRSADLVSISGHKIGAPKGIGALSVNRKRQVHRLLQPLMYGGGQELSLRPGTVPVPIVAGMGEAARRRRELIVVEHARCREVKSHVLTAIQTRGFTTIGAVSDSLANCVCVDISPVDAETAFVALRDSHCISNGSACTSSSRSRSHVLTAMGIPDEKIDCSIRLSWNSATPTGAIDALLDNIRMIT